MLAVRREQSYKLSVRMSSNSPQQDGDLTNLYTLINSCHFYGRQRLRHLITKCVLATRKFGDISKITVTLYHQIIRYKTFTLVQTDLIINYPTVEIVFPSWAGEILAYLPHLAVQR